MDKARYKKEGKAFTAIAFSQLPPAEREKKRHFLECCECGEKAFYRKQSKSGQSACFGAFHKEGCDEVDGRMRPRQGDPGDDELTPILNDRLIQLIPVYGDEAGSGKESGNGAGHGGGAPRGHYDGSGQRTSHSKRRLLPILKLLADTDFRHSSQMVEYFSGRTKRVCDLFVEFPEIEERHFDRYQGYWGKLSGAGFSKDGKLWLNTSSDYEALSITIYQSNVDSFLTRFNFERSDIEDTDLFSGAQILVFGKLARASTGKPGISFSGLEWIALRFFDIVGKRNSG
jgi:hypothetical protein